MNSNGNEQDNGVCQMIIIRKKKLFRHHVLCILCRGELGGHATSVSRVTPNAVHAIHVLHERGIDTAVARPPVPPIQPEETLVGRVEETRVDLRLWAHSQTKTTSTSVGGHRRQKCVAAATESTFVRPTRRCCDRACRARYRRAVAVLPLALL